MVAGGWIGVWTCFGRGWSANSLAKRREVGGRVSAWLGRREGSVRTYTSSAARWCESACERHVLWKFNYGQACEGGGEGWIDRGVD